MGWRRFFRRARWDRERLEELESYLQIETDENMARGMQPEEARAAAHRKLGNSTRIREEIYRMNTIAFLDALGQNLRYAVRTLVHSPTFTVIAVLTLALGIGANTAIFSVVNTFLIRPLLYPNPERLVSLFERNVMAEEQQMAVAPGNFVDWQKAAASFEQISAYTRRAVTLSGNNEAAAPERVFLCTCSGNVFSTLGVAPLDLRVLGVTAAAAVLASVLFGLYPAWDACRTDIRTAIAFASRTASSRRSAWTRSGLLVCEVALGTVLLVSAGLMIRTVAHFRNLDAAYDGRNVIAANVSLQDARYSTASKVNTLFNQSLGRIRQSRGVIAAGVGLTLPYERALNDGVRVLDGPRAGKDNQVVNITYVTPGYFEALRMRIRGGRLLAETDQASSLPVVVVNEAFAGRFFGDDSAIGRHLSFNKNSEIVGVVADVPQAGFGDPLAYIPNVYVPASQLSDAYFQLVHTWFTPKWVVRSQAAQGELVRAISTAIQSVDPQLPIARFRTMDEIQSTSIALQRLESALLGSLAGLALLLTAVGIYGLISHNVVERTREFGIRIALGCPVSRVIAAAARPGVVLVAIGIAIGYVLSRWASNLLTTIVYGVQLTDAPTYLAVVSLLLLVSALATFLPSLHITRIDPVRTLREE